MENNERDRKLDRWLDEALSEYSAAEPRLALEQRVLNRVRADGRARAQKWNFWKWMPAFGAIAALIVVAVAVRPVMDRKAPVQQLSSRINTDSTLHPQQKTSEIPSEKVEGRRQGSPRIAGPTHRNSGVRQQLDVSVADDDKLNVSSAADLKKDAVSPQSEPNMNSAESMQAARDLPRAGAVTAPPPPPEVPAHSDAGIRDAHKGEPAMAASPGIDEKDSKASAQSTEIQAPSGLVAVERLTAKSLAAMEPKERKRKRRLAAESTREDANVMDVFGVKVRFETFPVAHQFPTPVPLSKQEKLALAAAQQLRDSAVTQHKSVEIAPIEIKDLEIKPLGGPEK